MASTNGKVWLVGSSSVIDLYSQHGQIIQRIADIMEVTLQEMGYTIVVDADSTPETGNDLPQALPQNATTSRVL